jgi:hypothetical protein
MDVGAVSQPGIAKGEQCSLLTRIGARQRFVVHANEELTAFVELESAICGCAELS